MSLVEWIVVTCACLVIFFFGYLGVTGKHLFSFKDRKDSDHK